MVPGRWLLLLMLAPPAGAEIYTWTDAAGHTHYADQPPQASSAEVLDLEQAPLSVVGDAALTLEERALLQRLEAERAAEAARRAARPAPAPSPVVVQPPPAPSETRTVYLPAPRFRHRPHRFRPDGFGFDLQLGGDDWRLRLHRDADVFHPPMRPPHKPDRHQYPGRPPREPAAGLRPVDPAPAIRSRRAVSSGIPSDDAFGLR